MRESDLLDARYTVDTPENVTFAYDVAGIGSRFLAAIVDTLLLMLVLLVLVGIVVWQSQFIDPMIGVAIVIGSWTLLLLAYYVLFEVFWRGQSPGKRMVGLRVVRDGGRPVTFFASSVRNLVRLADFLPGFYGLGVIVMFVDQRARRLGDLAAGTLVVKEHGAVTLESLTRRADPLPSPATNNAAPVTLQLPNLHLITEADYDLVQEFLRRRRELGYTSRNELGAQLATTLRTRLGIPPDPYHEAFLEYLVYEYRLSRQQTSATE